MSEGAPMLSTITGVSDEQLRELLARGKQRGTLSLDDVLDVLRHVELDADTYARVRSLLDEAGVVLDESLDSIGGTAAPGVVTEDRVVVKADPSEDGVTDVVGSDDSERDSTSDDEMQTVIVDEIDDDDDDDEDLASRQRARRSQTSCPEAPPARHLRHSRVASPVPNPGKPRARGARISVRNELAHGGCAD